MSGRRVVLVTVAVLALIGSNSVVWNAADAAFRGHTTNPGSTFSSGIWTGWRQIAIGLDHACGISLGRKAYCWGSDASGQVGNGATTGIQTSPVAVDTTTGLTDTNVASISAGSATTCAVTTAGKAYCWGSDATAQIGNGATTGNQTKPAAVTTGGGLTDTNVATIAVGGDGVCAVTTAGKAYCWGDDTYAQLGNGATVGTQNAPYAVTTGTGLTDNNVAGVLIGAYHACALTTGKRVYCWGDDTYGEVGNGGGFGAGVDTPSPVAATGGLTTSNARSITVGFVTTCAVTDTDIAVCWGGDSLGEVGNGGAGANADSPAAVSTTAMTDAATVGGSPNGYSFCGATTAGKAYCWGEETVGELGNGATTGTQFGPSAVNVTTGLTGTNVTSVTAGESSGCAIVNTAQAYCWGDDTNGILGNGATAGLQDKPSLVALTP